MLSREYDLNNLQLSVQKYKRGCFYPSRAWIVSKAEWKERREKVRENERKKDSVYINKNI